MAVDIPEAANGDDPLRDLLIGTFETPKTFDSRLKTECRVLATSKGKQANIEDLQTYLSDFYYLMQGFVDRGQIEDVDDPDFNFTLISNFMANVVPLEMRTKMKEFRAFTFSGALARFRKYLKPDIIALINDSRAHNIAKYGVHDVLDYHRSGDTPKRANKVSTTESEPAQVIREFFQCENCVVNNALGTRKTKNYITFPCKRWGEAAGKPHEHPQRVCPDIGGYQTQPNPPSKVRMATRQSRPHTFPPSSPPPPRPPTPPTQSILRRPNVLYRFLKLGSIQRVSNEFYSSQTISICIFFFYPTFLACIFVGENWVMQNEQ